MYPSMTRRQSSSGGVSAANEENSVRVAVMYVAVEWPTQTHRKPAPLMMPLMILSADTAYVFPDLAVPAPTRSQ